MICKYVFVTHLWALNGAGEGRVEAQYTVVSDNAVGPTPCSVLTITIAHYFCRRSMGGHRSLGRCIFDGLQSYFVANLKYGERNV